MERTPCHAFPDTKHHRAYDAQEDKKEVTFNFFFFFSFFLKKAQKGKNGVFQSARAKRTQVKKDGEVALSINCPR